MRSLRRISVYVFAVYSLSACVPAFAVDADKKVVKEMEAVLADAQAASDAQDQASGDAEWEALRREASGASISVAEAVPSQDVIAAGPKKPSDISDVRYIKWPENENVKPESITVIQSNSQILRFDRALSRVAVSNTDVCDITTLGSQEVLLYCTKPGRINLLVWDQSYRIAIYSVQSTIDTSKLREMLEHIDPKAKLDIVPYGNSISIYGYASTNEKVKKIEEAARYYSERAIVYVRVQHPKQILLEVRFAEIDRKASSQYGLDWEAISRFIAVRSFSGETHSGSTEGGATFTPLGRAGSVALLDGPSPSTTNEFFAYSGENFNIQTYLKWLAQRNILKLIARPNLLALDGQTASFVVGGESPYITATTTSSNVEFKEFGTKLGFSPQIMDDEKIRLQMNVEVSELDFSSTVSLQGTTVPTLVKTTHQTVTELSDNQTLVVGGLINQRINKVEKRVPFLGRIPVVERAFSRQEFERKDTELMIVVTPRIVEPFENPVPKKELYQPALVADATSVSTPAYPDLQGDMINRALVQDERYHEFDGFTMKRAKEVEEEFARVKEKDGVMNEVLKKTTGLKIQEKATPFPTQKKSEPSAIIPQTPKP